MNEFCQIATMILRHKFSICQFDQSSLGRLLARRCPDEKAFQVIEDAIVLNLLNLGEDSMTVPLMDSNGRWVPVLTRRALAELVKETRAEVFRLMTGICEEIAAFSLRFEVESRTLYVKGREVAHWKKQGEDSKFQIDILAAFQNANWSCSIPNPLPAKQNYDDFGQVLRNLNKKLKRWLHFSQRGGHVFWDWA